MTEVDGRTAFITSGANGIGLGFARAFARLALVDIDEAALEAAKTELSILTQVEPAILDRRDRASDTTTDAQRAAAKALSAHMAALLDQGVSPDRVGEMVLYAVANGRLYVHTDRSMAPLIEARCKALLDAMPAHDGHDTTNAFADGIRG